METMSRHAMAGRPHREMEEKSRFRETFFSLKSVAQQRPESIHTEFMETDWDEDDILSELEDGGSSPRHSIDSSGRPSVTTLSTYDEVRTPDQRSLARFEMGPDPIKPTLGPRGPHLFRSSISSTSSVEFQNALSLSPITPKAPGQGVVEFQLPITFDMDLQTPRTEIHTGPVRFTSARLDTANLAEWAPEKVAQWMLNAGVEQQFAEKFIENDINGAILITLKFEDLKELGIASFGVRTKVWEEIAKMKDIRAASPDPETPIEDEPSREVKREMRRQERKEDGGNVKRSQSSRRRKHHNEDTIRPGESVSIVGIEQVLPKPHHCSKGEKCRKWQKQQRMIEAFKNDHPFVNLDGGGGGVVMVAGDPGNPATARAIRPDDEVVFRPISDAVPSVVASSDILGSEGLAPLQYLQQATLRNAQAREQQDNIQQFLELQHQMAAAAGGNEDVPPTPPFEMLPHRKATPHSGLKALSKLSIPAQTNRSTEELPGSACPGSACPGSAYPPSAHTFGPSQPSYAAQQRQAYQSTPSPSPDSRSQTPTGVYRFGTPFSEMDVPVTAHYSMAPVARDVSQSVPPEMNYHTATNPPPRSLSRSTFRRPSFMAMPSVDENMATPIEPPRRNIPSPIETNTMTSPRSKQQRPLQAPPRAAWPCTSSASNGSSKQHTPNSSISSTSMSNPSALAGHPKDLDGYQYQGYMKKRKTKMLRHEWHEQYVTLKGTRLAVHKDRREVDRTLEYIDIDDYAIACAGLASTSKLNAAFKAMSIRKDKGMTKEDIAAFSFQLIPQGDMKGGVGGVRLRKRESSLLDDAALLPPPTPPEASNGTGKTHHFAVRSRDERIDWMRELMLAKALRQKGEGFEVSVNGNMI
ncbi:hypothetical protein M406DRAFT_91190 [Cryphonectria parasitica EP155]|uniref:Uncharacterized protein n=1 Tax=Cryphonectria parasitica (strain ATCC 38755 / EP155) TaxID=660469 RepID=A0A9P5CNX6_CRYP1|nr:uncharacterized protein M406DRAFT_91190 [Cryphonectria parasitica EP155]KAF3764792.1 hypothetical protein M406DRAFT_91190 [Cryphonectria parasitica EP155]